MATRGRSRNKATAARRRARLPVDVVVLTRDRLQEVLDEAVDRGRMTRDDATNLLAELIRRSVEGVVAAPAERVRREVDRARRVTGLGSGFPISGYDDMTAAQVTERLADLTPAQLRTVRDHEKRNANRKSVLAAVERKLR
jgi:polyhydroxyalkanoate synthesis regulator phasin